MRHIKIITSLFLSLLLLNCNSDDFNLNDVNNAAAPFDLSVLFKITQDNSGLVTIRPNGKAVTKYEVFFGDGASTSAMLNPGQAVTHTYAEGNYNVRIVATNINGKTTELNETLIVSFVEPQNLSLQLSPAVGNVYQVNATATADFATFFEITFGENPDQEPIAFNPGQTVSHTYETVGVYEVTVVAYSGGAATSQLTQTYTVFDPLALPITFESATLNYEFINFGGAWSTVVDNPDVSTGNTSAKVGQLEKTVGAEGWAGSVLPLDLAIPFGTFEKISVKTWSPIAGAVVKLKVENSANPDISMEIDQVTTVANGWETLTFDFFGIDTSQEYQNIVIFFDFGNPGTGTNFYFDDIMLTSGDPTVVLPLTFETTNVSYNFENFGGAFTQVIENPDPSGINTSNHVGSFLKTNGAEVWAGSFIELDLPIDFSSLDKIKIKTWSPQAGITVLLKLENLTDSNINTEIAVSNTQANAWEELIFDFAGIVNSNNYQRVVIFFDFGTSGNGSTFYFDDIELSN